VGGRPPDAWRTRRRAVVDLGGGVKAAVPLALWSDGTGTLPRRAPTPPSEPAGPIATSAADRATRLATWPWPGTCSSTSIPTSTWVPAAWPPRCARASRRPQPTTSARSAGRCGLWWPACTTVTALLRTRSTRRPACRSPGTGSREARRHAVAAGETAVQRGRCGRGDRRPSGGGRGRRAGAPHLRGDAHSGDATGARRAALGPEGEVVLTLSGDGAPREVRVRRTTTGPRASVERPGAIAEIGPGSCISIRRASRMRSSTRRLSRLSQARGVIFEMRGYPRLSPCSSSTSPTRRCSQRSGSCGGDTPGS